MDHSAETPPAAGMEAFTGIRDTRASGASSDRSWDFLTMLVGAFILASVARIHLLFPVLETLRFTMVAGGAALILYAINHHPARRLRTIGAAPTVFLLVFLGWMAFTVPWGLRQYRGGMFVLDNFLKTVALFVLIAGCIRGFRDVERLAFVYFVGAAIYAGVVTVQQNAGGVGGESWRLSDLVTYDANDFAVFAVTAVPFGMYFLGDAARSKLTKIFVGGGLAVMAVAFVQSGSRGGFLAMAAVMVFLLLRYRAIPLRWRIGGIGLLGLMVAAFASQRYWEQMTTLLNPGQDYNFTAETGRIAIWSRGLGYLWDNPILGVGPSNFPVAEGVLSSFAFRQQYGIGVRWTAPHNSFLQTAVELGVPGLLLFLGFLGSIFLILRRLERLPDLPGLGTRGSSGGFEGAGAGADPEAKRAGDRPALAQAIMGSLIGFLVGAFFLSLAYSAMLYTLAALAVGLWKTRGATASTGGESRNGRRGRPGLARADRNRGSPEESGDTGAVDRRSADFVVR